MRRLAERAPELSAEMSAREPGLGRKIGHAQRLGVASVDQVLRPEEMALRRNEPHRPSIATLPWLSGDGCHRSGRNDLANLDPTGAMRSAMRRVVPIALLLAVALFGATAARADNTVLNQTQFSDATGDSGGGADLSGMTVTSYTDGTIQFAVQFANRQFMQPGDTVQIFIDLNDDGNPELNLSVWPSFAPSYLDRWNGTAWIDIRQLPELVQAAGSISVRLALSDLQGAGAVPVAPVIQAAVGSWQADSSGNLAANASDFLPSATSWSDFSIKPVAVTQTTTAPAATTPTTGSAPRSKPTTTTSLPVTIAPLAPLSIKSGKDLKLHVLLKSKTGPMRLFKVCTQLPATSGLLHSSECRSTKSTGAKPVSFTITYKLGRVGTNRVAISATAGNAHATATEIVHVTNA